MIGKLFLNEGTFTVQYAPHIMIRLKALFRRVNKFKFGEAELLATPETAKDLRWFIERYPVECAVKTRDALHRLSNEYDATQSALQKLLNGEYEQLIDGELAKPLRDYQARARDITWVRGSILLADELGLGKSVTAMSVLVKEGAVPAVVLCKAHLPGQWRDYFAEFLPKAKVHIIEDSMGYDLPRAHVYIVSYHKIKGWVDRLGAIVKTIIIDECQELRRRETKKWKATRAIRDRAKFCMGLSATPIFNYGGEFWNVMEVIQPDALGSWNEFTREWCSKINQQNWLIDDPDTFGAYLRDEFLMVLRTRTQVGRELPPIQTMVRTIEYDPAILDKIKSDALELARVIMKGSFHESGIAARELDARLRQQTGLAKAPAVAAFVQMLVWAGNKVLLTGWHRAVYDVWREWFTKHGIKAVMYTGSESPNEKLASLKAFKGDAQVMMISNRSGDGIDGLQGVCSTIVHGELDWAWNAHKQLTGRLFRDGQTANVQEFFLICDGGSDPVIVDVLGLKKDQSRGILAPGVKDVPIVQTEITKRVRKLAEQFLKANRN